jgi:predicted metal-dependent phosphoesterase TrpH
VQTKLVDFHLHTTCSDGAWAPDRLFEVIRERGLEYFGISDHDTMAAYPVPDDLRQRCVAGLEVDTFGFEQTVHVLGYGVGPASPLLSRLWAQQEERRARAQSIIERLNKLNVAITIAQVESLSGASRSIGRPHIARALVESGHCSNLQDAFDRYLADEGTAYVPLRRLSTLEAIDLIHESGGIAVLAHPRRLRDQSILSKVCRLFDGIELVHPSADAEYQRLLIELIDANGLVATGGTDFHARPSDPQIGIPFSSDRLNSFLSRVAPSLALAFSNFNDVRTQALM